MNSYSFIIFIHTAPQGVKYVGIFFPIIQMNGPQVMLEYSAIFPNLDSLTSSDFPEY